MCPKFNIPPARGQSLATPPPGEKSSFPTIVVQSDWGGPPLQQEFNNSRPRLRTWGASREGFVFAWLTRDIPELLRQLTWLEARIAERKGGAR